MATLMAIGMPSRGIIPTKLPGHYIRYIIYWLPSWQMCQRWSLSLLLLLETSLCRSSFLRSYFFHICSGNWVVQMSHNFLRNPIFRSTRLRISLCVRRLVSVKIDIDPMHAMKAWGGKQVELHSFLTSTLVGVELGLIPQWPSTRGKRQLCPLARTKKLSGRCGKQKTLSSAGHETKIAEPSELSPSYSSECAILPFAHAELRESASVFSCQYHSTSVPYWLLTDITLTIDSIVE